MQTARITTPAAGVHVSELKQKPSADEAEGSRAFLLLENQLQAQLDCARATRPKHGVRTENVRRKRLETEAGAPCARRIRIRVAPPRAPKWIRDIGVIKNVEKLDSELRFKAFSKGPYLRYQKIQVVIRQTPEHVRAERTVTAKCRRDEERTLVGVTAEVRERCHCQRSHGLGFCKTGRIAGARIIRNPARPAIRVHPEI